MYNIAYAQDGRMDRAIAFSIVGHRLNPRWRWRQNKDLQTIHLPGAWL